MRHLNYNHLYYFWTVAREGSFTRAAQSLFLTPQTVSGQIKALEDVVGSPVFDRSGRRLGLTETGRVMMQYADEMFTLGAELSQRMKSENPGIAITIDIGVVNSIAKLIASDVIDPAFATSEEVRITCWEGDLEPLLADMAVSRLDLVISDKPMPRGLSAKAYNHHLGESTIGFFCPAAEAAGYAKDFPRSLDAAPMLLPLHTSALRRRLDDWFESVKVRPRVVAEFDDTALMKAFGSAGRGLFPAPMAISSKIENMYDTPLIGEAAGLTESYYAISPERKIVNPGVLSITKATRQLFEGEAA